MLSARANCATPVILCHLLGARMAARGRGGIALVSSTGGTQGAGHQQHLQRGPNGS
ncbi:MULTISPECIES: hypothetical protein [unclassified Pseudofrankia]|uniref:hypothetical protein n=1 Tax=unclassified Pseudofrankia TaxID=2994372 RepID=UPI001F5216ED|nr:MULTISPECIES: hypothetical protein [unclassified Pseudofrankia]MDT3440218.1 hypothetical protein [Pseudofrankia sp. BMG5.37]